MATTLLLAESQQSVGCVRKTTTQETTDAMFVTLVSSAAMWKPSAATAMVTTRLIALTVRFSEQLDYESRAWKLLYQVYLT